jgi:DNA-directed RNA polymerase subunit RPC12/RpoP
VEPTESPTVRVLYGNGFSPEQRQKLAQKVKEWINSKGVIKCALCREEAYDFEDFSMVFLPSIITGAQLGRENRNRTVNERRWVRSQMRGFRVAAEMRQAMQLTCDNCGYVILLDSRKTGATVEFID